MKTAAAFLLAAALCQGQSTPAYPVYAIASGPFEPALDDLEALARNFTLVQAHMSAEYARKLHAINPNFRIVRYLNSTYTQSASEVPEIESKLRSGIAMFEAARLAATIDAVTTNLTVAKAPGRENLPIKASTGAGLTGTGDTKKFVMWLRIDDELVRVEDVNGTQVKVTRAFAGSKPAPHSANARVFSPVYLGSTNTTGAYPGGPGRAIRYALDPATDDGARRAAETVVEAMREGSDGGWLDILSPGTFNLADAEGGHCVPWDFVHNRTYKTDDWRLGQERKVRMIQETAMREVKRYPVLVGNNMQARWYEPGKGGGRLLMEPTQMKPRPLDGYCIESFTGAFPENKNDPDSGLKHKYQPYEHWRENIVMLMDAAQRGLPVYPMMANAGIKSLLFEKMADKAREQFELYSYASFLLGVEKNGKAQLGFPPFWLKNGKRVVRLSPFFYWQIGAPAESRKPADVDGYRASDGKTYMRRFGNGVVLVNSSEQQGGAVALPKPLYDPETKSTVSSVTLAAHTGKMLLEKH